PRAERLPHLPGREAESGRLDSLARALGARPDLELFEETTRLRRQLVQAAAEHRAGQSVGDADIVRRDLHVLERAAVTLEHPHLALVLVEERDAVDQRQVLLVIPAGARA